MNKTIHKALERCLKAHLHIADLTVVSINPIQNIANLNNKAVSKNFVAQKYQPLTDNAFIGFNPVRVDFQSNGKKKSIELVIKGHKPGAFVDNLCPNTLEMSGIYLPKPYSQSFVAQEFKYLSEGEYHYYPFQKTYGQNGGLLPAYYGRYYDYNSQCNYVFLELLTSTIHLNEWQQADGWPQPYYECVIDGLAKLHAVFLGKNNMVEFQKDWLAGPFSAMDFNANKALWQQLHQRFKENFPDLTSSSIQAMHQALINTIPDWWQTCFEHCPKTIIHGDFNPRNIGFRRMENNITLLALDWECVRWGLPQLDLVEFILHSSHPDHIIERMTDYSEQMRQRLSGYSGTTLDKFYWHKGIIACTAYHLLNRAPLIALMAKLYMPGTANFGSFMYRNAATYLQYAL